MGPSCGVCLSEGFISDSKIVTEELRKAIETFFFNIKVNNIVSVCETCTATVQDFYIFYQDVLTKHKELIEEVKVEPIK